MPDDQYDYTIEDHSNFRRPISVQCPQCGEPNPTWYPTYTCSNCKQEQKVPYSMLPDDRK